MALTKSAVRRLSQTVVSGIAAGMETETLLPKPAIWQSQ